MHSQLDPDGDEVVVADEPVDLRTLRKQCERGLVTTFRVGSTGTREVTVAGRKGSLGENGSKMSGTTSPTVRVLLVARLRATPLGP